MSDPTSKLDKYRQLEEIGLANIEALLDKLGLEWRYVLGAKQEIDILAKWRNDRNFGSCRFNIARGVGADFAERPLAQEDLDRLGKGLTLNDTTHKVGMHNTSTIHLLDIVQRLNNCDIAMAAEILEKHLAELGPDLVNVSADAAFRRQRGRKEDEARRRRFAIDLWESAKYFKYEGSPGELYLTNRKINIRDKNIRVHNGLGYIPTKQIFPALLFKVQHSPESDLCAIHRIFLTHEGKKADIGNPKMALGKITGNGIWFGTPCSTLHIGEGPETALSLVALGLAEFVCCAVSAVNLGNINVELVSSEVEGGLKEIIVCADRDEAGETRAFAAANKYNEWEGAAVKIMYPKEGYKDFNDEVMGKLIR